MNTKRKCFWSLDPVGRVIVPAQWRRDGEKRVEISIQYGNIVLQRYTQKEEQNLKERPFLGIVREYDDMGRVVIPMEMRVILGIQKRTQISIKEEGQDRVCLIP